MHPKAAILSPMTDIRNTHSQSTARLHEMKLSPKGVNRNISVFKKKQRLQNIYGSRKRPATAMRKRMKKVGAFYYPYDPRSGGG